MTRQPLFLGKDYVHQLRLITEEKQKYLAHSTQLDYVEKIDKSVEFPLELDLQSYTSSSHNSTVDAHIQQLDQHMKKFNQSFNVKGIIVLQLGRLLQLLMVV